jgi:hypothetical protein
MTTEKAEEDEASGKDAGKRTSDKSSPSSVVDFQAAFTARADA